MTCSSINVKLNQFVWVGCRASVVLAQQFVTVLIGCRIRCDEYIRPVLYVVYADVYLHNCYDICVSVRTRILRRMQHRL